nr:RNA-directed DNA polymerase, eukaryota [Tanacetum cinerariifolium]
NRTMAQMLQAPIEGYEDAIVVPPINANNFELKQTLINLVQSNQFTGRQDPHNNLRFFNKVTSTFRHPEDLLRQCPHHGFSELHQLDTFYNALNPNDQDALDSAAGGNFLDKIPRECLSIIESKSKIAATLEDKLDIRMNRFEKSLIEMKNSLVTPTVPFKAVTKVCVTCGSNHSYNQCPLTRGGNDYPVFHDNIQQFQTTAVDNFIQNRQNVSNQTRSPGFHRWNGLPDDLTKRANLFCDLKDIDHKDSIDLAQKAKIKWAVEGNENSKFFHGIVNKKRRHLAIKVFVLEDMVSNKEIKRAVWDCGSDKSQGPDGFTFEFFKKFWTIVGGDVTNAIKEFFISSSFPKGCNSSFITLIPKVMDVKHLKDFRPISLNGCQYKIIGKILANRLSLVIGDIVSQEQSAFIKGRQIMDGPLILNEVIS